ncbi:class I SAM-dependent methyltransferase [Metabacillus sp. JX24]|uniref:class I SAM-dependent methyltransferase n=1 Tax=Metabacillus sp. JX24 TaxID=3240759 RepID=UPI00350F8F8C
MIVTTAGRTNPSMIRLAEAIANDLKAAYISRKKQSVQTLSEEHGDVLVVGKNRLEWHKRGGAEPFFFHPNSAMFRLKRLQKGEHDPLIAAADLKPGNTFLDCTLGLGSDSITASYAVGTIGNVTAAEANPLVAYLVEKGLETWETGVDEFDDCMRRIQVKSRNHVDLLKELDANSYDVVYFDPMFEEAITESDGIGRLRSLSEYSTITDDTIKEAKRVAAKRVVLKDHWKSPSFDELGFQVFKRKSAKFHYGVIEIKDL